MSDWSARWKQATKRSMCTICEEFGHGHQFIKCIECGNTYHKTCVSILRTKWDDTEKYICDVCDCYCQMCEKDDNEDQLLICDGCNEGYHMYCLDPPLDAIPEEGEEWYCPDCEEDYASDEEWAKEHVVPEDEIDETWTRSECTCKVCSEINQAVEEWKDFKPQTAAQQCIKEAVDEHEQLVNTIMDNIAFRNA